MIPFTRFSLYIRESFDCFYFPTFSFLFFTCIVLLPTNHTRSCLHVPFLVGRLTNGNTGVGHHHTFLFSCFQMPPFFTFFVNNGLSQGAGLRTALPWCLRSLYFPYDRLEWVCLLLVTTTTLQKKNRLRHISRLE
jgi:hypothetical protein